MAMFWNNKRVLVTGVTGFVGGNLVGELLKSNASVFGIIRQDNPQSYLKFEGYDKHIFLIRGDLMDHLALYNTITENQIDIIFHLAAQVEVGIGLINPFLTFETNVRGTYSLLEACRMASVSGHQVKAIVLASSDKAYGEYPVEKMPYQESYPLLPKYPYDTSKACADLIGQAYAIDHYKLPIVITRFSNIYGPGQLNFSAIIPDGIRSALGYSIFTPRSDGTMVRDFVFVKDVIDLYLRIGQAVANNPENLRGQIFNAGSNNPIDIRSLIEKIFNQIGNIKALELVLSDMLNKQTKGEINYQHMAFKKVQTFFQWMPKTGIDEGLKKSIEWYNQFLNNNIKNY